LYILFVLANPEVELRGPSLRARRSQCAHVIQTGINYSCSRLDKRYSVGQKYYPFIGPPPVYIGFGSNPITSPGKYNPIFEQVRNLTNQRLIISKGWAGLPENNTRNILYVDEMPFELLFPRLAAVIYHGGTGTMAAITSAGIPQAAFPFMGDQFDNRKQIVRLGLGPATCDFKNITAEAISSAVTDCVTNDLYRNNALELSKRLQNVHGIELTDQHIEREFNKH